MAVEKTIRYAGSGPNGLFHSYNMLMNLKRAFEVKDKSFMKMFDAYFETLQDEQLKAELKEAFKKGTVTIEQEDYDGAVIKFPSK
jgi:hypothetical protein